MKKFLLGITVFEACVLYFILPYIQDDYAYSLVFAGINFCIVMLLLPRVDIPYWLYRYIFIIYGVKFILFCLMYQNISTYIDMFKIWDVFVFFQPGALDYLQGYSEGVQFYSKVVACIYYFFGIVMEIPVFVNIMVSLFADILFYKILSNADLSTKNTKVFFLLFMLLPWRNLQSLYMVREAIPTFFVVVVVFYIQKFLVCKKYRYLVQAVMFSLVAMLFHSGLVALVLVTMFMAVFFDADKGKLQLQRKNIFRALFVLSMIGAAVVVGGNSLFYKFQMVFGKGEAQIAVWSAAVMGGAGSVYLQGFQYTSALDIVWQSPLRLVYFLFSPMPWDWRNLKDVFAFSFDAMVQIVAIGYVLRNLSNLSGGAKMMTKIVFIMYIFSALTFGAGTFDSGTAMRHRAKITSMIIICMAVVYDYKQRYRLSRGER